MKKETSMWIAALGLIALMLGLSGLCHFAEKSEKAAQKQTQSIQIETSATPVTLTPIESPEEKGVFSSLRVGAVNYTVKWRHGRVLCGGHEPGSGCTNYLQQLMEIDTDQGPDQMRDTVLHEVLHTVVGFDENIMNPELAFSNEGVAYKSSILLMILRDNPDLTKFLLDK